MDKYFQHFYTSVGAFTALYPTVNVLVCCAYLTELHQMSSVLLELLHLFHFLAELFRKPPHLAVCGLESDRQKAVKRNVALVDVSPRS